MKFTSNRPYADPEKAARKMIEIDVALVPAADRDDVAQVNADQYFR
jgi:hypothetical protein